MITMGIDIGSLLSKVVIMDGDSLISSGIIDTTGNIAGEIDGLVASVLSDAGIEREKMEGAAGTGSGAELLEDVDFCEDEVTCVGTAAGYLLPEISMAVDIGGQSITAVLLDAEGEVINFMRNDKCASGSGRFLEVMSGAVGIGVDAIDKTAAGAKKPVHISSQCGVFAESEVISHVNAGEDAADIVAGLCDAVASIVVAQARKSSVDGKYTLTGGVARIDTISKVISGKLGGTFFPFPHDPRLASAIGAALLAGME